MSLLANTVYANPVTPCWTPAGAGGGPTGPTGPAGGAGATGATGPAGGGSTIVSQQFSYKVAINTAGGTAPSASAWYTRPLNTAIPPLSGSNSTTIAGMSLNSSNYQITVPAGTYQVWGNAGGVMVVEQARLNATNSNNILLGTSVGNDNRTAYSTFTGTIVGPDTVSVQFNGLISSGAFDWGQGSGVDQEVYAQVQFTKIA